MNHIPLIELNNTQKGKTAFVCGMGPSLANYLDRIENKSDNEIVIACNDVDEMTNIIPDYWVMANSIMDMKSMKNRFEKFQNCYIVHADSVDTTDRNWIEENLQNPYVPYDQRHFNGQKCDQCPNGCLNFIENRLTIQEILQNKFNFTKRYSAGCTVALHMVSLALILGCNKIYIMGVDLNYELGYVDGKTTNSDRLNLATILPDFNTIKDTIVGHNIQIFNTSTTSELINIFESIYEF